MLLTHQQFFDDIMIFWQETLKEARGLMEILNDFTSAFGMEINKDNQTCFSSILQPHLKPF